MCECKLFQEYKREKMQNVYYMHLKAGKADYSVGQERREDSNYFQEILIEIELRKK